jgi:pimeloyl-ACP methyl ester carboxylesterase
VVAPHGTGTELAPRAVEIAYDSLECTVTHEVHHNDDEHVAPLDPLPCPVTVAWAENDILLPLQSCGTIARERLPQAKFVVLPDVGHDPMLDDPELVARTILEATGIERV